MSMTRPDPPSLADPDVPLEELAATAKAGAA
jgi:hypothetical protein